MNSKTPLPVDSILPQAVDALRRHNALILEAAPGAGKTTRVPPALLELGHVLVLEPRRIAARMAARRVATEMGERVGETVGYQVRFEGASGPRTRLRFVTEGVLTRRLLSDPRLVGIGVVVLDEFHERHLDTDLALALLRRLQLGPRPDLKIAVMSATLEGDAVAKYLGGCPVLRSEGRLHPIEIEYKAQSAAPLEEQVRAALDGLLASGRAGDILVFLPGAAEIRGAQRTCQSLADRHGYALLPLHGDLSPEEQDRAVLPGPQSKVILSTNVAESSLTIEGVTAVIDSGLHRIARDSPWTGIPSLEAVRISRASATQRAGRAGRTAPGRVIRLFPQEDFLRRPPTDQPELARRELSGMCLSLRAMGLAPADLPWIEPPPSAALNAAEDLLRRLDALDADAKLTPRGERMAALPVHPRLAAMVADACERGAGHEACGVAALLGAGDRLPSGAPSHHGPSDLIALLEGEWSPQARRLSEQIRALVRPRRSTTPGDAPLLLAVLSAFHDRLARRRSGREFLLLGGGSVVLAESSVVDRHDLIVAVDIEERRERGLPLVRLASGVQPEWLLDLFPGQVTAREAVEWNRQAERAEAVSQLLFGDLVIEESRSGAVDSAQAAELLARKAMEAGLERFTDPDEMEALAGRIEFARQFGEFPPWDEAFVVEAIKALCQGLRGLDELRQAARDGGLIRALTASLSAAQRRLLDDVAPERVRLPGGRQARVHYPAGKPPWTASRLQDFFGMRETPRVGRGSVPLIVHLLAPSQRPVQTTMDLAGFWERLYPQIRRELSRRYPKHAWPEDPLSR